MGDAGWAKRAAENLLPLSEDRDDLPVALKEWVYSGDMDDLEHERSSCGLCEHPDIRFEFEIVNRLNGNSLLVGSECIKKFEIPALDDQGRLLTGVAAKRKVNADRRTLIRKAESRSVITSLLHLSQSDAEFEIESFIAYYRARDAFTPKQIATVMWRLKKHRIQHNKRHFRVALKRDREKDQLGELKDYQLRDVLACMTPAQRRRFGYE
jgi:hypothetical protein